MGRFLTVDEVARELQVRRDRVYELARDGILPVVRLGRTIRIDREAFEEWVRRGGQAWPGGWRREGREA
ncbi:MAG: helix-turn-helix domain-containing protein [Bacillota bacterium]